VKKVIKLLEEANTILATISPKITSLDGIGFPVAISNIQKAIAELKTPRWYTPERWEAETGEPWPDNGAVWQLIEWWKDPPVYQWLLSEHRFAKTEERIVVCATEAGPPPDGWRPEEEK
jgi:hypothetical protein